jgi:cysteine desulfurase
LRARLEGGAKDVHAVSTSIEHSSVLEVLRLFEKRGVRVTYVAPGPDGVVRADDVLKAITPATALVSVMYANNEIGTIQPVSKIGAGVRKIRAEKVGKADAAFPVFHTDASQAPAYLSCELEGLRADAMTLDAHKMYGPRGVGSLIVRRHVAWEPLMAGGGQERGMRPTTESVSLVAGFARALELAAAERESRAAKARKVRDALLELVSGMPGVIVNGSLEHRLPNNANISILTLSDAELAVLALDHGGIACSTKSSCLKGEEESYVVCALGGDPARARTTLRFTFGDDSRASHARRIAKALQQLIAR